MKGNVQKIGKARRIVGIILLSLCAALLLYCAAVMVYRMATVSAAKRLSAFTRFLAEFGILCLVSFPAFDLAFGIFSWGPKKAAKAVGLVLRVLSCVLCAVFVALGLTVAVTAGIRDGGSVEAVCILGNAIDGDKMSDDLVYRLDTALAYHDEHPDALLIVTGGNTGTNKDDAYYSEAGYMARYLIEHGVDDNPDALVREPNAMTTVENFVYVAEIVDKEAPLAVVTTNHHMFRASHLAKKQGYTSIVKIPAPTNPLLFGEGVVWETVCSFFSILQGKMAL